MQFQWIYFIIMFPPSEKPPTPCQNDLAKYLSSPPQNGAKEPRCTSDGYYDNIQCSKPGGECWCVDEKNQELPETRSTGFVRCPKPGILPTIRKENVVSDVERIDSWISFYLSKISDAKFSILYDISLVEGWREKIEFDRAWDYIALADAW